MRTPDSALVLQNTAMHFKDLHTVMNNKANLHALCSWAESMLDIELPNAAILGQETMVKGCGVVL